jgi:hypothetical protein
VHFDQVAYFDIAVSGGLPQSVTPVFLNQPRQVISEGERFEELVDVWGEEWRAEQVEFYLRKSPQGMRLMSLGPRGCCRWWAILMWNPEKSDVGEHEIEIELRAEEGVSVRQKFNLRVLNRNVPPQISSSPPLQIKVGETYQYDVQARDPDPTNDTISYRLLVAPSGMSISENGQMRWRPNVESVGKHGVTIEVSDSWGATTRQVFVLEVVDTSGPPRFVSQPLLGAMVGQPYIYQLRAIGHKANRSLRYRLGGANPSGLNLDVTGLVYWTPTQIGRYDVEVEVEDDAQLKAIQSWTIEVVEDNNPPRVVSDPIIEISQGEKYRYVLEAKDEDGDALSFVLCEAPAGMSLQTIEGSKQSIALEWQPDASAVGIHRVEVRVDDGKGGVAWERSALRVLGVDQPPQISSVPLQAVMRGEVYRYIVRAERANRAGILSFALNKAPTGMTIDATTGEVFWHPQSPLLVGKHEVEIEVKDRGGLHTTQSYQLQVFDSNAPPTWRSKPVQKAVQGVEYVYQAHAINSVGKSESLWYRLVQQPPTMQIDRATGEVKWQPTNADVGENRIIVEALDSRGGVARQSYMLRVEDRNDAPMVMSRPIRSAQVGQKYVYRIWVLDPDPPESSDILRFTLHGPSEMKLEQKQDIIWHRTGLFDRAHPACPVGCRWASAILKWLPTPDDVGTKTVSVQISDGRGAEITHKFDITVHQTNNPPVLKRTYLRSIAAEEGVALIIPLEATDPDGDELRFVLEQGPLGLTLDQERRELHWIPRSWDVGRWIAGVRVEDGRGGTIFMRLGIEVANRNNPPLIVSKPLTSSTVGAKYNFKMQAIDPDPEDMRNLRWSLRKAPGDMQIEAQTGVISWISKPDQAGVHEVEIQVADTQGATAGQSFLLWVRPRATSPQITSQPEVKIESDKPYLYAVEVQATTGDLNFQFQLLQAPSGMVIDRYSGVLRWHPSSGDLGSHPIEIEVSNAQGQKDTQDYTLEVTESDKPPVVISNAPPVATVGQQYIYNPVISFMPHSGIKEIKLLLAPTAQDAKHQMSINPSSRQIEWIPAAEHAGKRHLVILHIMDQLNMSITHRFSIDVAQRNQAPQWKTAPLQQRVVIAEGSHYKQSLEATDPDGDTLYYSLEVAPAGMLIRTRSGHISWRTLSSQVGIHSVIASVVDERGGQLRAQWEIEVTARNNSPQIISTPHTWVFQGQFYQYQLQVRDPDIGDKAQYVLQIAPPGMSIDAHTGLLQWQTSAADLGRYAVQVRVTDRQAAADIQSFWLEVRKTNFPPQIYSQPATYLVTVGKSFTYRVQATDANAEDLLTYSLIVAPLGMSIDPVDGTIYWIPSYRDEREVRVTIQVSDSSGATDEQSFVLQIEQPNIPPRFISMPCHYGMVGGYRCVLQVEDLDPGLEPLRVERKLGPADLVFDVSDGGYKNIFIVVVNWVPQPHHIGVHLIEIEIIDDKGGKDSLVYSLQIISTQDIPVALPGEDLLNIPPGEVILDGSQSREMQGHTGTLGFYWQWLEGPQKVVIEHPNRAQIRLILRASGTYVFSLEVSQGEQHKSLPSLLRVVIKNLIPSAEIWIPYSAQTGQSVILDGSASSDANGLALLYHWKQTAGPSLTAWEQTVRSPVINFPTAGLYRFSLVVEEDRNDTYRLRSLPIEAELLVYNLETEQFRSHAEILAPKEAIVGQNITLDGRRSRDLLAEKAKGELSYEWELIGEYTDVTIANKQSALTIFSSTQPGYYALGLTVRSSKQISKQAVAGLQVHGTEVSNKLPIAHAVEDYAIFETWHQLDASQSKDPNNGQLSFEWRQIGGTPVILRDEKTARPSFFVLNQTTYRFQLRVKGQGPWSSPRIVVIPVNTASNRPPIAHAGEPMIGERARTAGQVVILDGSKSYDPEKHPLVYRWRQVSGFPVALSQHTNVNPQFVPVTYGILRFSLEVSDGITWSRPSFIDVVIHDEQNKVPHANAGPDQTVRLKQSVTLDGSASYDGDPLDKLIYHWRLLEPVGHPVSLNLTDPIRPSFTPQDPSESRYIFGLSVDDGKTRSLEDTVTIHVLGTNRPPIARILQIGPAVVNRELILDGSKSSDPDGDKLTYKWQQLDGPNIEIRDDEASQVSILITHVASYRFQLQVSDGMANSAPISILVQSEEAPPPQGCNCQYAIGNNTHPPIIFLIFLALLGLYQRYSLTAVKK